MSSDPFITLAPETQTDEQAAKHVIREHHLGRSLTEILADRAVNRRRSKAQIARLFDRPEVVRAAGEDFLQLRRECAATMAAANPLTERPRPSV
jgi:hypothetical protein